ncbi:MAG: hypothetical protein CHACPFDD_00938 [Phycisphaerae bacterium]|nr:hypothetical protein [Phycisphaerae bacterium]
MRRLPVFLSALSILAATTLAQTPDEQPAPRARIARPDRPARQQGGERMRPMVDRLVRELDLDEAQKAELDRILESQREQMSEMRRAAEEMRAARQAGDEARLAELREKFGDIQRGGGAMFDGIFDQLAPHLRPDQKAKLETLRSDMAARRPGPQSIDWDDLAAQLKLDDVQRAKFDEIVARARDEAGRAGPGEELRGIYEEMRTARDGGDDAKVEELRAKIADMRRAGDSRGETAFDEIAGILRDDQKAVLTRYRERVARGRGQEIDDPRQIVRIARRLDLTDDQLNQLGEIEEASQEQLKDDDSREHRATVAKNVTAKVRAILDAEQVKRFDEALSRRTGGPRRPEAGRAQGERGVRRAPREGQPREEP